MATAPGARGLIPWRPFIWWACMTAGLYGTFFFIAYVVGWPTSPDRCIGEGSCFCELFDETARAAGDTGIRQPVNTLSNLYAIGTSLFVALFMLHDRRQGSSHNAIKSTWWICELWVVAVLFLGQGSMWFHASISGAISWLDSMSMFVFASFLVFYTLDRGLSSRRVSPKTRNLIFLIGYTATVLVTTLLQIAGVDSFYLIFALVLAYLGLEFFYAHFILEVWAMCFWLIGVFAIANAILFWALSQTGQPLCFPDSGWQWHGLAWHPLAGVMAVMMYLYWRREYVEEDKKLPARVGSGSTSDGGGGWS